MAKISTYDLDNSISGNDKVIGTDADNLSETKNFKISDLSNYILNQITPFEGYLDVVTPDSYIGTRLTPKEGYKSGFWVDYESNSSIGFGAKNTSAGDGAVAIIGVSNKIANYESGISIFSASENYYKTEFRDKGILYSPNDLGFYTINSNDFVWYTSTGDYYDIVNEKMRLSNDGFLKLNSYGSGNITGTVTYGLGVNSDGDVIEFPKTEDEVSGIGTTNNIAVWTNGPESILGSSSITQELQSGKVDNVVISTPGAAETLSKYLFNNNGFLGVSKTGNSGFLFYSEQNNGFYEPRFKFLNKIAVDKDSVSSTGPSLDVGSTDHTHPAAWFRNGVVISNNPSGVDVDNTSMVIGAGNNDNISGSDHCLIVGSGNQILNNSDQSIAFGQGNYLSSSTDALAAGNNNTVLSSQRTQSFGFNNTVNSASSFIAGGDNSVVAENNAFVLGYNHNITGDSSKSFLFGQDITLTGGQSNYAIGTSLDAGAGEHMVLGYRNYPLDYPTPNKNLGLGDTKFIVSVGSGTTTPSNNNAVIITEGGINGGSSGTVPQVPRIILPQQETLEFVSDTDATAGGIPTGGLYRNGNDVKINFNETAAVGNEGLAYLTPQLITASAGGSSSVDPNYNLVLISWTLGNGVYTLNLPLASANTNRLIRVTTDGTLASGAGDKIDITATGGETIDGNTSFQISKRYEGLAIYSTGTEWIIVQAKAH